MIRSASRPSNQASACSGGIWSLGFRCAEIAQPISSRAVDPDMQNWKIAVTVFSKTPLLDTIRTPQDLRRLKIEQVRQVGDELRQETIHAVSATCGHFCAGLAARVMPPALHHPFVTTRHPLTPRL